MFKSVKRLISWTEHCRKRVTTGYVFSFFGSIFMTMPIMISAFALNLIINDYQGISSLDFYWIPLSALLMIAAILGKFIFSYFRAVFQDSVAYERTADERIVIGDILKRVPFGFFAKNSTGEISAAVTTDLSYFEMYSMKMLDTVVNGYIEIAVMTIFIFFFNPVIGVIALSGVLLSALALHGMAITSRKNSDAHQEVQDDMISAVIEYIRGITLIKAYGNTGSAQQQIRQTFKRHKKINIRIEKYFALFNAFHLLSLKAASVGIIFASVFLTLNGQMSMAIMLMMSVFSFIMFNGVEAINNATHVLKMLDVAMDKIDKIKAAEFIDEDSKNIKLKNHDIVFNNVTFSYEKQSVLRNVSCILPQGKTTAIVGPSGSGKTTMVNLISRFYDIDSGTISIGGHDIRNINCDSLLQNISMVFQKVYLFNDTIENNIRFGKPDATEEEVIAAAKAACCHDFILNMPNGYKSAIGDGGCTLSGGEKQRISIARAILKNSPIVILDEATASIDPENERLVQRAISNLVTGKTIIIIAHRLATIKNADQILVLNEGNLENSGSHKELLDTEGIYKRFWEIRRQAEAWQI